MHSVYIYIYAHKQVSASMSGYVYLLEGSIFTLNTSDEKVSVAPQKAGTPKSESVDLLLLLISAFAFKGVLNWFGGDFILHFQVCQSALHRMILFMPPMEILMALPTVWYLALIFDPFVAIALVCVRFLQCGFRLHQMMWMSTLLLESPGCPE